MIKQQFFYNDQEIMRIYHDGFDDYPRHRTIHHEEKLSSGTIVFHESWIDNLDSEVISYDFLVEGFLPSQHDKNPYGTLCCDYKEFITEEKSWIQEMLSTNSQLFNEISDFLQKWSGFNLRKSPYTLNNVLVFTPTKIEIEKTLSKENERNLHLTILRNDYGEITCIAKFKLNHIVVDTKLISIQQHHLLESNRDWNTVDIELYSNNRLVYAYYDLSFIKSIHINMGVISRQVEVPLQLSNKTITLKKVAYQPIVIGEKHLEQLNSYFYQEKLLTRRLTQGRRFEFITKGQYERALEIFGEIAGLHDFNEMWIYDPYFIDYRPKGGKARINDILKVLGKNIRLKKNIVFEADSEEVARQQFEKFREAIKDTVEFFKKRKIDLNFTFYGTKEHFHDRFLFLINEYSLKAFMLGTSFNSFGDNYSAIIELDPLDGKKVFDILNKEIVSRNHIVLSEGLQ